MPSVFSFQRRKKKKKKPVKNLTLGAGVFPDTFSSQHGAVDLDYIPFMSPLCFQFEVVFCNARFWGVKSSYCLSMAPELACFFCYTILLCFP